MYWRTELQGADLKEIQIRFCRSVLCSFFILAHVCHEPERCSCHSWKGSQLSAIHEVVYTESITVPVANLISEFGKMENRGQIPL